MSNLKYLVFMLVMSSFCFANTEKAEEEDIVESFTSIVRQNYALKYAAALTGAEYDEQKKEKGFLESIADAVEDAAKGAEDLFGLGGTGDKAAPDLGITLEMRILKAEIQKALFAPKEVENFKPGLTYYLPIYFYGPTKYEELSPEKDFAKIEGLRHILENIVYIDEEWPKIDIVKVEEQLRGELLEAGVIKDKNTTVTGDGSSGAKSSEGDGSSEVDYGF